jgi:succinate dehydrogenase / fumarate reductase cytochrome b subunit
MIFDSEMDYKYIQGSPLEETRYYPELVHRIWSPIRTICTCTFFCVLLALHLVHGFASSFQSVGFNNKYSKGLSKFAYAFSIIVP